MSSHSRLFEHSEDFGGNTHSLLLAIGHHCNRMEIVLKRTATSILSMGDFMPNTGNAGVLECET